MRLLLCVATAMAFSAPLFADEFEDRLAVAKAHVAQTVADLDMNALIEQMYAPVLRAIEQQTNKTLSPEQIEEIDTLYKDTMAEPLRQIMLTQDETMANVMTMEEITAIKDFYETENGRSAMKKLPQILAAQQPQVLALVQGNMPAIMPRLREIVEGELSEDK